MSKILVSGLVNIETSLEVNNFPIEYCPIEYPFHKISTCVSGVGFNVSKALKTLGSDVYLTSIIGNDINGEVITKEIDKLGIPYNFIKEDTTATSLILVDSTGRRKIYCDLKSLQERSPLTKEDTSLDNIDLAVLTNINYNRKLLHICKEMGITIACDVHVLTNIYDEYNKEFMECSNILFLSNEGTNGMEGTFMKDLYNVYHNDLIVMGCGIDGVLAYVGKEDEFYTSEAKAPRGVKSTIGAGDALFSSFIHFYHKGYELQRCLDLATLFAGIKISCSGGSNGFVSEEELLESELHYNETY